MAAPGIIRPFDTVCPVPQMDHLHASPADRGHPRTSGVRNRSGASAPADRISHVRKMVHLSRESSNYLFEVLSEWNQVLKTIDDPVNDLETDVHREVG